MALSGVLIEGVLLELLKPRNKKLPLGGLIGKYFERYKESSKRD